MTYKLYFSDLNSQPITGLSPVWDTLIKTSDGTAFTPQPVISELSEGFYKFSYDGSLDLIGRIDGGNTLDNSVRFATVEIGASSTASEVWNFPTRTMTSSAGGVALPVLQGQVYIATAMAHKEEKIIKGDTPRVYFDLNGDYSGWTPQFWAKTNLNNATYDIPITPASWLDATKGNGYFDLTSENTSACKRLITTIELIKDTYKLSGMRAIISIIP